MTPLQPEVTELIAQGVAARAQGDYAQAAQIFARALQQSPGDFTLQLALATTHLAQGRFAEALAVLEAANATGPQALELVLAQAAALRGLGRGPEAIAALEAAVAANPKQPEVLLALAGVLEEQGYLPEALTHYEAVCQLAPTPAHYAKLGEVCLKAERFAEAKTAYVAGLKVKENEPSLLLGLGIAEGRLDNHSRALDALRKAARLAPQEPEAHFNLALSLEKNRKHEQALKAFKEAIALRPNHSPYHIHLGAALMRAGQAEAALAAFGQAVAIDPSNLEAQLQLQIALLASKQHEVALTNLTALIAQHPANAHLHNLLGAVYAAQKDFAHALSEFETALTLAPNQVEILANKVFALRALEREAEALAAIEALTQTAGDNAKAWQGIGLTYLMTKDYALAKVAFEKALHLQRDLIESYLGLSTALLQLGEHASAEQQLEYAIEHIAPHNGALHLNLALIYMKTDRPTKAKRHINKSFEKAPEDANAYLMWGQLLDSTDNDAEAEVAFRKAVELDPENGYANYRLARTLYYSDHLFEAWQFAKQAFDLDPKFKPTLEFLIDVLNALNCLQQAASLIELWQSQSSGALISRVLNFSDSGRFEAAAQAYQKALEIAPKSSNVLMAGCYMLTRQGRYDEALEVLEAVGKIEKDGLYFRYYGFISLLKRQLKQAIEYFEKALQLKIDAYTQYDLGMAYSLLGNQDEASKAYTQALALDRPTLFSNIRSHLWELGWYLGQHPEAKAVLTPVIERLEAVCEDERVPMCPDISDVVARLEAMRKEQE